MHTENSHFLKNFFRTQYRFVAQLVLLVALGPQAFAASIQYQSVCSGGANSGFGECANLELADSQSVEIYIVLAGQLQRPEVGQLLTLDSDDVAYFKVAIGSVDFDTQQTDNWRFSATVDDQLQVSQFRLLGGLGTPSLYDDVVDARQSIWFAAERGTCIDTLSDLNTTCDNLDANTFTFISSNQAAGDSVQIIFREGLLWDQDQDGLPDSWEVQVGFNPTIRDENDNGNPDGRDDIDGDGLSNLTESLAGTIPFVSDTDDDGLSDGQELSTNTFGEPIEIAINEDPLTIRAFEDILITDLDNDGDDDIVYTIPQAQEVGWFENDGNAQFVRHEIGTGIANVHTLHAADLDGDGDLDIAADTGDGLAWYEQDALTRIFYPRTVPGASGSIKRIVAGDIDGDQDLDLVITIGGANGQIDWYENTDGFGSFELGGEIQNALDAKCLAIGDRDQDGDLDVLSDSRSGQLAWYENVDGTGTFANPDLVTSWASPNPPWSCTLFDSDHDGDPEWVAAQRGSLSAGIFWEEEFGSLIEMQQPTRITKSDVSGDGFDDILVSGASRGYYFLNQPETGDRTLSYADSFTESNCGFKNLAAGDINGDGILDLISTCSDRENLVWRPHLPVSSPVNPDSDGDGMLDGFEVANEFDPLDSDANGNGVSDGEEDFDADGVSNAQEGGLGTDPRNADTDNDGLTDGDEQRRFDTTWQFVGYRENDNTVSLHLFNPDNDDDIDVLLHNRERNRAVWHENLGNGQYSFEDHVIFQSASADRNDLALGDVNGDSLIDITIATVNLNVSNTLDHEFIHWYQNTGNGTFANPTQMFFRGNQTIARLDRILSFDADGDQHFDLFGSDWIETRPDGSGFDVRPVVGNSPKLAADFNGDGENDFIDENLDVYLNYPPTESADRQWTNTGSFPYPERASSVEGPQIRELLATDVDGDDDLDLVISVGYVTIENYIAWHENDGEGNFGPPQTLVTGDYIALANLSDIDLDGFEEIVFTHPRQIFTLDFITGDSQIGTTRFLTDGPELRRSSPQVADIDLDGIPDLIVADHFRVSWLRQFGLTNPAEPDSDGDGLRDGFERDNRYDPNNPDQNGDQILDGANDDDLDGLSNQGEQDSASNPRVRDSDGDGLNDGFEVAHGLSPTMLDSNENGTPDGLEDMDGDGLNNVTEQERGTNPQSADTDGDGANDGEEVQNDSSPTDANDCNTCSSTLLLRLLPLFEQRSGTWDQASNQ